MPLMPVPTVRVAPDSQEVLEQLGLLRDMPGSWSGKGFNLIARPDFEEKANLYLQLNQTDETLEFDPIGSAIPNRGFDQKDIQLFGLTYLDKIHDAFHGGALHIEPGIWVRQPPTTFPKEEPPTPADEIIARMASIPHGNAILARGIASHFQGPPTLPAGPVNYNGSLFPSFNSTPFPAGTPIMAAGSSELGSKPTPPRFEQYNLKKVGPPENQRTPLNTGEPALPADIDGVEMQKVVNDPITLLQATVEQQKADGHTFEGTVLNIATQSEISFLDHENEAIVEGKPQPPSTPATIPAAAAGVENIPFLQSGEIEGHEAGNAHTVLVYATFWIEKVSHPTRPAFMQLQYAQMTVLDFPIFAALAGKHVVDFGWPHVSVGTLRRTFL
jgi:hypothetical protein